MLLRVPLRNRIHNPHEIGCPLALRRVCGVCKHFDGELRGRGFCADQSKSVKGNGVRAESCAKWTRKTKGVDV